MSFIEVCISAWVSNWYTSLYVRTE